MISASDRVRKHRHADQLLEELNLGKSHLVVTPAIRESRKASKKEGEHVKKGRVGNGTRPRASVEQTGAGRGKARRHRERRPVPGKLAWFAGVSRLGATSRAAPRTTMSGWGEPVSGEETTRRRARVARNKVLGCNRSDIQYAAKKRRVGPGRYAGEDLRIRVFGDAQALLGLSHQSGLAKARHTETACNSDFVGDSVGIGCGVSPTWFKIDAQRSQRRYHCGFGFHTTASHHVRVLDRVITGERTKATNTTRMNAERSPVRASSVM